MMTIAPTITINSAEILPLLKPEDFKIGKPASLEEGRKKYCFPIFTEADVEYIKLRAERGEAEACRQLALCRFYGMGEESVNIEEAFHLYLHAAEQGHVKAMFSVATSLFLVGYKHEDETLIAPAIRLHVDCADTGFVPSKYYLWYIDQLDKVFYRHYYPHDSTPESRYKLLQEAAAAKYPPAVEAFRTALTPDEEMRHQTSVRISSRVSNETENTPPQSWWSRFRNRLKKAA